MSKKNFRVEIATGADRFFSVNDVVEETPGEAEKAEEKPYRINLKLKAEYRGFLVDEAWRQRKSVTALINEIIGEYFGNGDI